jgi:hypothetical protein
MWVSAKQLAEIVEAVSCRLDALLRCCLEQNSSLRALHMRKPVGGNFMERQVLLAGAAIETLAMQDARRRVLFFAVDGVNRARLSTHPSLCQGGFTLESASGPLILTEEFHSPIQNLQWYGQAEAAGVVVTVIEVY